ncbi:hypothetical protein SUGI_0873160 [Cryptomeria japonica]|nr:hypothetical protein SUGI_0873160 [Cryptomeria japonica]
MATKSLFSLIALASLSLLIMICDPVDAANVFTVGDDMGWTTGFDYQAWAEDKQFHVKDVLVFNYPQGFHNVLVVNGSSLTNCVKESAFGTSGTFESGQDNLEIQIKSGNIFVISSVGQDCENGMKLKMTVTASPAPARASSLSIGDSEENSPIPAPSSGYRSKPW